MQELLAQRAQATSTPTEPRSSRLTRALLGFGSLALLASCVVWGWLKLNDPGLWPVNTVKIQGQYPHLNHKQFHRVVLPALNSGFIKLDVAELQNQLQKLPWIDTVHIQRLWPDTLLIKLTEQVAVVRFGEDGLLNETGALFKVPPETLPPGLPWLLGPPGQEAWLFKQYQEMAALLKSLQLKIVVLSLTPRNALELKLNNGMTIVLGREDFMARLQRFIKIYRQVFISEAKRAEVVDLRYGHGMAVQWRST